MINRNRRYKVHFWRNDSSNFPITIPLCKSKIRRLYVQQRHTIATQFNTPINFFLAPSLPSFDSIPIIPFRQHFGILWFANGTCYIPKIGVYNQRTITEGSRNGYFSHFRWWSRGKSYNAWQWTLSTCVWNDSTKFAQNVSEDNSRVHVCVCACMCIGMCTSISCESDDMGLSCMVVI